MSTVAIRTALTKALKEIEPALDTAWENGKLYEPVKDRPYQRVNILPATPRTNEIGRSYIERGILQVMLLYPQRGGTTPAGIRVDLIRAAFYRGRSLTPVSGITTHIGSLDGDGAVTVYSAMIEGDRYAVPVRVPFYASITV